MAAAARRLAFLGETPMTTRRELLTTGAALVAGTTGGLALHPLAQAAPASQAPAGSDLKILRYAFLIAETGFDPAQITDLYSRTVAAGMFEAPLEWAFMAQPPQMRPCTLAAMPEVSADFKTFTFHLKPGTYFADDPAFKGSDGRPVRRELVAQDYVFSIKRHYDPRWNSGNLYLFENAQLLGLSELRKRLMAEKKPFDYDAPVEGLRALDRYSFQIRLAEPAPRFLMTVGFADGSVTGAMAREVVEAYGDKIPEHPVGTGPFLLKAWRRSSRIVLAKNPNYREVFWDETPPASNARLQALVPKFKGKRLPLIDEVHISIIEEAQPRWLSFNAKEQDLLEQLPADFAPNVIPNNQLAPYLEKRGITLVRYPRADVSVSYFGMENPVVGGYEPHKVALRRAISLAVNLEREIRLVRRGQAIPGQGVLAPGCYGYDPAFKSESSDYNLGRAKALLDLHGYVDKNGDGWREQPNGEALVLDYATSPDAQSRQLNEQWKRNMNELGIQITFKTAKWPENLKASRAGKLMMWGVGWSSGAPDGDTFLALGYGPNKGGANHARFNLPAFNALYEKQRVMPDGPERLAVMKEAQNLMVVYMPYKVHAHRVFTDLAHPWVVGYHRNVFMREFFKYVDIDLDVARQNGIGVA
jgi:ABC-type transport system substrate-binding protein